MKNKLSLSLLAFMGFNSCSMEDSSIVMYGTPVVDFRVMGEVVDSEGNPINEIEVTVLTSDYQGVLTTDENGAFMTEFSVEADNPRITFTDLDGAENGGEFETKQVNLTWSNDCEMVGYIEQYDLGTVTLDKK